MRPTATKHVPMRRCVVCRASLPQAELFRLVREGDAVELDLTRKLGGRGTWVCRNCAAAVTEKRLRQAFKGQAPQVAQLLSQALAATPQAGHGGATPTATAAATHTNGGLNV
ncbi:MAG: YlxR family protein [Trueperaceae bacterium]